MNRVLRRGFGALNAVGRWYLSPTGVVIALVLLAAATTAIVVGDPSPLFAVGALLLFVVFPYKLTRTHTSLSDLQRSTLDRVEKSESTLADESRRLRAYVHSERRNYLSSLETARAEWADLLSSERLLRDAETDRLTSRYEDALGRVNDLEVKLTDGQLASEAKLTDGQLASEAKLTELHRALETIASQVSDATRSVETALRESERQIITRVDGRLRTERGARLLETARLSAGSHAPERLTVIITPQRTGSTLLMDALRAYPGVGMWPTANYFIGLGAGGRRYPGDLSPDQGTGEVIEVQPGVGGIVPMAPGHSDGAAGGFVLPTVGLEKIHPVVVDFDPDELMERIDAIKQTGVAVDLVYQVRDPVDSIRSFLAYQQRAERWHTDMSPEAVVALYHTSYLMMDILSSKMPGPVVAYPEFKRSPAALGAVYEAVFDGDSEISLSLAAEVLSTSNPERRQATQKGPFVDSDRTGVPSRAEILLGWPMSDQAGRDRVEELMAVYQRFAARAVGRVE